MTKGEKREYGKRIKKTISGFVVNGAFCCDVLFYAWAIFLFRTYTGSVLLPGAGTMSQRGLENGVVHFWLINS